ncbi:MAG: putative bifunctional diguanylate cyclase/phosphodiesterase [Actinomycetota bacterium]
MGVATSEVARGEVSRRLVRRFAPRTGAGRVWILNVALICTTLYLLFEFVWGMPVLEGAPFVVPWWVLAIALCCTEIFVVHIEFRRDAHSFSLSEIPIVLALFFAVPHDLVIAQFIGAAVALYFHRRQSPLKLVFNVSHFCLEAVLTIIVFHWLLPPPVLLGVGGWVSAFEAILFTTVVGVVAIFVAISLSEGRPQFDRFSSVLGSGLVVATSNTSIALIAATVMWTNPSMAWLMAIPTTTVFLAYKAYSSERHKHQSLEFLYEATRILHESSHIETAMVALLSHAREMFRAEIAEITIFPMGEDDYALRTTVGPEDREEVMIPVGDGRGDATGSPTFPRNHAVLVSPHSLDPALYKYVADNSEVKDAMIGPLHGETRVIGVMVVANRMGDVSTFDSADLKLFETLSNHASVSLENGRLEKSLQHLQELKEELKHQATHDPLTHLPNRTLFTDRVEHALQRRDGGRIAVLFLDLDDFKTVNDSLGHVAGDELLVDAAARIQSCLRLGDTAARLGGDEFAVLVENTRGVDEAIYVAERITRALKSPFLLQGNEVFVHASIGIAFNSSGRESVDDVLRNADVAMYRAKAHGKGCYEIFETDMHAAVLNRMELKGELQRAIQREELFLCYQPIVDLLSGRIRGFEALLRWHHPKRGILLPGDFVSLAEDTGLIVPISQWVFQSACEHTRTWRRNHPRPALSIAVNLSPRHLQQMDLVDEVASLLRQYEIPPANMVLELTENILMQDSEGTISTLRGLKEIGVKLAIDDFGTGFSSLGYLKRFPIDYLKIAKYFVDGLKAGATDSELVHAIIKLGKALGLQIVAEGIETDIQHERLRALGCHLGQGNRLARPLAVDEVDSLLALESLEDGVKRSVGPYALAEPELY